MKVRACAVIPVFDHHAYLEQIVCALLAERLPCILVDDGSCITTKRVLVSIQQHHPQVDLLTLPANQGKGAAVLTGLARAAECGYSHALQIDADGQHNLADIPAILQLARRHPHCLISGLPVFDDSIPAVRLHGRRLTNALAKLETLSLKLRDAMCGFRVYPVEAMLALDQRVKIGRRMDFDTDCMVRLYWAGIESEFLPTKVGYPKDGTSHFRMFSDNTRMTWLHIRLVTGMLLRMPKLLRAKKSTKQRRGWPHIGERGSLLGLRFIGFIDRTFGRYASLLVLYPVTAYFFVTHPRARRASRQFLIAAGAKTSLANRFRHFMGFSVSILDKVASWHNPKRIKVEFPDRDILLAGTAHKRGVLLLTAHLGNMEVARAISEIDPLFRCTALVYTV
ncbi:MAG: glycosyltransferase family 2 protein, partial [Gammaproteobacteria bacterium]|nr:glycosyltransferase family 2 protein [Gammaproteobacteria bacterium]